MLLALAFATAACELVWSYDGFKDQTSTGGSAPSSSSSSGEGSTASSGGGSTASSGGDSAASSGGGSMASSGGGSMASSGAPSSSSSSSGCALDDDMDDSPSWKCNPADSTLDCADQDPRAFPGAGFEASPIMGQPRPGTQPWDLDCDGVVVQETPVLYCGGFVLCASGSGFQPGTAPACGMAYTLGHCVNNGSFFACQWNAYNPIVTQVQRCK